MPTPVLPSSLKIGKPRHEVRVQRHVSGATMGEVSYTYGFIQLATNSTRTGRKFRRADVHDTFLHEVTHGIMWEMGHRPYRDEELVGQFANVLNRAIESARFERCEGGSVKRLEGGAR